MWKIVSLDETNGSHCFLFSLLGGGEKQCFRLNIGEISFLGGFDKARNELSREMLTPLWELLRTEYMLTCLREMEPTPAQRWQEEGRGDLLSARAAGP